MKQGLFSLLTESVDEVLDDYDKDKDGYLTYTEWKYMEDS